MLDKAQFLALLDKYTRHELTEEEAVLFFTCLHSDQYNDVLAAHIDAQLENEKPGLPLLSAEKAAQMQQRIIDAEQQTAAIIGEQQRRTIGWKRLAAAACLAGLLIAGALLFRQGDQPVAEASGAGEADTATTTVATDLLVTHNSSNKAARLVLDDGSTVLLQPGARLRYPASFEPGKRVVHLEGEAFFDVAKRPKQPFFVYAKNIVTHVLGTSFNVKDHPGHDLSEVRVKSGKVEVFLHKKDADKGRKDVRVILFPNQKATYHAGSGHLVTALVELPLPLSNGAIQQSKLFYEDTPLSDVMAALQQDYGIDIVPENESIYQCLFTGDISQQDLFTKLDMICRATNASYEIVGTRIVIRGRGCL